MGYISYWIPTFSFKVVAFKMFPTNFILYLKFIGPWITIIRSSGSSCVYSIIILENRMELIIRLTNTHSWNENKSNFAAKENRTFLIIRFIDVLSNFCKLSIRIDFISYAVSSVFWEILAIRVHISRSLRNCRSKTFRIWGSLIVSHHRYNSSSRDGVSSVPIVGT